MTWPGPVILHINQISRDVDSFGPGWSISCYLPPSWPARSTKFNCIVVDQKCFQCIAGCDNLTSEIWVVIHLVLLIGNASPQWPLCKDRSILLLNCADPQRSTGFCCDTFCAKVLQSLQYGDIENHCRLAQPLKVARVGDIISQFY